MASNQDPNSPLKCVIVGDSSVGKTTLAMTYFTGIYPKDYAPNVMDSETKSVTIDGLKNPINLSIWDTPCHLDFERLRKLSYVSAHVFIICFSVDYRQSFERVSAKWCPEVQRYSEGTPMVLLGTKADLRYVYPPFSYIYINKNTHFA